MLLLHFTRVFHNGDNRAMNDKAPCAFFKTQIGKCGPYGAVTVMDQVKLET